MKTGEIAEFLEGELRGDAEIEILRVCAFDKAADGDIVFLEKSGDPDETGAACVIVGRDGDVDSRKPTIRVSDPKLALALIAERLYPIRMRTAGIHETAVVSENAEIGENVHIGAFVCIGEGATIGSGSQLLAGTKIGDKVKVGSGCILHENVVLYEGSTLGDKVILHAGVVIGADGFGYVRTENRYVKFPQIGTVVIENNVEIGANSCIDRGSLGETRIGEGTKIDNLVQIAHNVQIGKCVVIAAQTGISGSTIIEDDCVIGGQVGMGDHARVMSGAVIGSQAGVLPGKIVRPGVWWGTPVQPLEEYKRQNANVKGLDRLKTQVRELRTSLSAPNSTKSGEWDVAADAKEEK